MVFFLKNVFFAFIIFGKTRKSSKAGKIESNDEEKDFFEDKTFSSYKLASLPNWEGAKYAVGSRQFRFLSVQKHFQPTFILLQQYEFLGTKNMFLVERSETYLHKDILKGFIFFHP